MIYDRKKVVITGASSGIGAATARRFAAENWDVCVVARREQVLRELVDSLPGGEHLVCAGDYASSATAESISKRIAAQWGTLDALINCAGLCDPRPVLDSPLDEWRKVLDVMLDGAIRTTRAAAPLMTRGGRIIHVTSVHGDRAERGSSAYGMAKAAINQYCRALALELADKNILVNAIAPGFIDTPMSVIDGVNELQTDWFNANYVQGHHLPLKRAGTPEEVAGVAYFLAGPDAGYITGQVLTVDGGLTITF